MSQPAQAKKQTATTSLISTFYLGDALLGIDTLRVQEIIKVVAITSVHQSPDYVLGIINLRGRIVTIIDLGRKLGLDGSMTDEGSRIIIVDWNGEYVGLMVDRVSDVVSVAGDKVMPSPSNVKGIQGRYFRGVFSAAHLIAILNVEEVLADEDLV